MPARTGQQYLEGLSNKREIWLNGEQVEDVTKHPLLCGAAQSVALLLDFQHHHPDAMLMLSPDTSDLVGVTHILPRTRVDLEKRRQAVRLWSELTVGTLGRSPDYLNVTVASFAGRQDVWARRGNEQGAENLLRYHYLIREKDLILTHALINPQVDRLNYCS